MTSVPARALRRVAPLFVGICVVASLFAARAGAPQPFERLRLALFDEAQRWAPRAGLGPESPVLIVDVDEAALGAHGQWPWPRTLLAQLTTALQDAGAAAIAFDAVFAEPDRTSPARLAAEWRGAHGLRLGEADALPDHDRIFAEAIARGRVVLGYPLLAAANGARALPAPPFATIGPDPALTVQGYRGGVPNLAILDAAAAGHGSFAKTAEGDEIVRRMPLVSQRAGVLLPGLVVEALRVAQGEETLKVRAESEAGAVAGYVLRVGALDIPLDADGGMWLHHAHLRDLQVVSAAQALDPAQAAALRERVGGRIVLVGTSAAGLSDLRPTPLSAYEPGVAIHANALEQILSGHHLRRPAWTDYVEPFAGAALGLLAAAIAAGFGLRAAGATALALLALPAAGAWLAFRNQGLLFDPSFAELAVAGGFGATMLTRHLLVERDAARLRSAFAHYLSPDLVAALARDPGRLKLGGETREMTFLFTDLEGFTAMTESRGAEALVALLNAYLDGLCGVAMAHGGTVDKIVGDAVHVMFNAPLDQPDHAARAVECARAMDAFARAFAAARRAEGIPFGATRIGVNTGPALVGNFGGARRFDYTAHGDAINTAARLEAANKALGTRICVAGSTVARCPGLAFRPIGCLTLRGKAQAVPVFDPLPPEEAGSAYARAYAAAYARLEAGEAAPDLMDLHACRPDDPVVALHARRIRAGETSTRIAA